MRPTNNMTNRLSLDIFISSPRRFDKRRICGCLYKFDQFGLACQGDTQPIPYFLADSGATNAVDWNIIPNSWAGHERFPVVKPRGQHRQGEPHVPRRSLQPRAKDPARTV